MSKKNRNKFKNKPKNKQLTQSGNNTLAIKPKWQHILLIIVLGFIVYSNSLSNPFTYDDMYNIVDNSFIKDLKNIKDLFTTKYFVLAQESSYRPVVTLSYFINYSLCKLNVIGWHIVNVLFHVVNGVVIYLLICLITKNIRPWEIVLKSRNGKQ